MTEPRKVALYEGELSPGTTTYQGVHVEENGDLVFEAQDVGEMPKLAWGDSDYEWWVRVAAADKPVMLAELRAMHPEISAADDDSWLLALVEAAFGGRSDAVSMAQHWLDERSIAYEFHSWV